LHELSVFKNLLSAEPYQRIILTEDGHAFYSIARDGRGSLNLSAITGALESHHA